MSIDAERLAWGLVTLCGMSLAAIFTWQLVLRRERSPTLTTVETTAMPISRVEFPTINLCASGIVNMGRLRGTGSTLGGRGGEG